MTNTTLKLEINALPKAMREEVADFVEFQTPEDLIQSVNTQLKRA